MVVVLACGPCFGLIFFAFPCFFFVLSLLFVVFHWLLSVFIDFGDQRSPGLERFVRTLLSVFIDFGDPRPPGLEGVGLERFLRPRARARSFWGRPFLLCLLGRPQVVLDRQP